MPITIRLSLIYAVAPRGVSFDLAASGPLESVASVALEYGFEGIEFNIADPRRADVRRLYNILGDYGLEVAAISTGLSALVYGYTLSDPSIDRRMKAVSLFESYIGIAGELWAGRVVVGLARGRCAGDCQAAKERLMDSLRRLEPVCRDRGVILALEPINRYETDLINSYEEAAEIARELGYVRILYDTFHATLEEGDPYRVIDRYGDLIGHVHFADTNRGPPGSGIIDWGIVVERLVKAGYRGFASVEARHPGGFKEVARISSRTLIKLLS